MTRRSGLGRGLDALLPSGPEDGLEERSGYALVDIDAVVPNPRQPRHRFDDAALDELAVSIRELGLLQPVLVRANEGGAFELIAGERRWRAARAAGLERIPAIVLETDDRGSLERALVENIHRSDLNPIEEAAAFKQLLDDGGLTHEALGDRVGRSRVTITNALRLLDLPVPVQRLLIEERLSARHGRALLGLGDSPFLERLAKRAADEGLSVRETEELVRRYEAMTSAVAPSGRAATASPALTEVQHRLADHLQTRVRVEMGKRKGKIVLDFASLDELSRLADAILGPEPQRQVTVGPGELSSK